MHWIDIYQRLSDYLIYNAETQFASAEFKQYAGLISISIKKILIEAHYSIDKVERYYIPVHCTYEIIKEELTRETISKEIVL